jgi:hypothetical protein
VVALAALTFVAALADTFGWKGWWVTATLVLVAGLGLVWKLWQDVVEPAKERAKAETTERVHATAVEVAVTNADDGWVSVSVLTGARTTSGPLNCSPCPSAQSSTRCFEGPGFRRGYGIGTYLETPEAFAAAGSAAS